jgi:hypothetical protein
MCASSNNEHVGELHRTMLAVAYQLISELDRGDRISRRALKHPDDPTVLSEWRDSLKAMNALAEQYAHVSKRYQHAKIVS